MWPPSSNGSTSAAAARAPSSQTPPLEPPHLWPPLRCGAHFVLGGGYTCSALTSTAQHYYCPPPPPLQPNPILPSPLPSPLGLLSAFPVLQLCEEARGRFPAALVARPGTALCGVCTCKPIAGTEAQPPLISEASFP